MIIESIMKVVVRHFQPPPPAAGLLLAVVVVNLGFGFLGFFLHGCWLLQLVEEDGEERENKCGWTERMCGRETDIIKDKMWVAVMFTVIIGAVSLKEREDSGQTQTSSDHLLPIKISLTVWIFSLKKNT